MKRIRTASLLITCLLLISLVSAQDLETALKGDFRYQFASAEGFRTHFMCGGITAERHFSSYNLTFGLTANFLKRINEIVDSVHALDDVWYISLAFRYYYGRPLTGTYVGFVGGLGFPAKEGVYRDLCYQMGYQLMRDNLVLDLNTQIGLAGYDTYDYTPEYTILYAFSGFVFKAGISAGIGF